MSKINKDQIDITNLGLEDLSDSEAANCSGGFTIRGFDSKLGNGPNVRIADTDGANLTVKFPELSKRIGVNVDNAVDGFVVENTTPGARYRVLAYDKANGTGKPEKFFFSGDQTLNLRDLKNKVSRLEVTQLSRSETAFGGWGRRF